MAIGSLAQLAALIRRRAPLPQIRAHARALIRRASPQLPESQMTNDFTPYQHGRNTVITLLRKAMRRAGYPVTPDTPLATLLRWVAETPRWVAETPPVGLDAARETQGGER